MHELSIVTSIVETVTETLNALPDSSWGGRVKEVRLRVGALASVIPESLEFCYGIAAEGTPLEGSRLVVNVLPVVVHCAACGEDAELEGVQSFRCPKCGEPSYDLRQGRELEIESFEIEEMDEVKEKL
ncbi:MAG: hydrogenase maturation nickel metallochaperone HypA [Terracidiphilus sp.]|jgi:hydrogenase nickel incorporation protein HypA/HybF